MYECILISDSGDVEVLGRGTLEDIVRILSGNDLQGVSLPLIEQDIDQLCEPG